MLLAVLGNSPADTEALCARIRRRADMEPRPFFSREAFFSSLRPGQFGGAVIALGDSAWFLAARRLRETDIRCRILVIDDTDRYALQCVRLHVTDFLVRPVTDERLERSLELLMGRR